MTVDEKLIELREVKAAAERKQFDYRIKIIVADLIVQELECMINEYSLLKKE